VQERCRNHHIPIPQCEQEARVGNESHLLWQPPEVISQIGIQMNKNAPKNINIQRKNFGSFKIFMEVSKYLWKFQNISTVIKFYT